MANQMFKVMADGKDATVEVSWNRWSYEGDIKVDNNVVRQWGKGKWVPKWVEFEINEQPAIIRRTGWFIEKWYLETGGRKYE